MNMRIVLATVLLSVIGMSPLLAMDNSDWRLGFNAITVEIRDDGGQQRFFELRRYEFETMTQKDKNSFLDNYDYEGVLAVLNDPVKAKEHCELAKDSDNYFAVAKQRRDHANAALKDKGADRAGISWLVWELFPNKEDIFYAQLGMAPYVESKPEKYAADRLWSFGLNVHRNYRGNGLDAKIMARVLTALRLNDTYFNDSRFCLRTQRANVHAHNLAEKLGFRLAKEQDPWTTVLKSGEYTTSMDLYIE